MVSTVVIELPTEPCLWRKYVRAFQEWELRGCPREEEAALIEARDNWERAYLRQFAA